MGLTSKPRVTGKSGLLLDIMQENVLSSHSRDTILQVDNEGVLPGSGKFDPAAWALLGTPKTLALDWATEGSTRVGAQWMSRSKVSSTNVIFRSLWILIVVPVPATNCQP